MITRLEIDGFKSFVDFTLDVPPFLAIVGANASGKSNLIDALRAMDDIARGGEFGSRQTGRTTPNEAFHQREDGTRLRTIRFTSDVIADVERFGGAAALRYQAIIDREKRDRGDRIRALSAQVTMALGRQIQGLEDRGAASAAIHQLNEVAKRLQFKGENVLDITGAPPGAVFNLPFEDLPDTRFRAMWLLAKEVRGWHVLNLLPSGLRNRSLTTDLGPLSAGGENLASVLGRISQTDAMWDLVADAIALIPGLRGVDPAPDGEYWDYRLEFRGTGKITPRMASDGTLRVLGILAALHDPDHPGVVIVDEIENGLHPSRLTELLHRLRARVTDWRRPDGLRLPTRQVIFTTHSPVVLASLLPEHADDTVFLTSVFHPWNEEGKKLGSVVTRARPIRESGERGTYVTPMEVRQYLETARPLEPSR